MRNNLLLCALHYFGVHMCAYACVCVCVRIAFPLNEQLKRISFHKIKIQSEQLSAGRHWVFTQIFGGYPPLFTVAIFDVQRKSFQTFFHIGTVFSLSIDGPRATGWRSLS